ncbi:integrase/recombinase, partial [mine drainage metagenome]
LNFNDVTASFNGINIAGEYENRTLINERVPSKEELSRILKKATSRGKVSISIMAFSGFRSETLGNYEGTDGLRLGDIKELKISDEIEFTKIPATIM